MNDGPELYQLSSVNVIPTSKPRGIYFALRYLYEGYNDIIDPWEETKSEADYDLADVDAIVRNAWQSVPSNFRYGEK
jgi:hypothetical protein